MEMIAKTNCNGDRRAHERKFIPAKNPPIPGFPQSLFRARRGSLFSRVAWTRPWVNCFWLSPCWNIFAEGLGVPRTKPTNPQGYRS